MTWHFARSFLNANREHPGELPVDIDAALRASMQMLLAPNDFVLYERHDPAMIARMVRLDGERYILRDARNGEEEWVGAESLLQYGKPIDEWFDRGFHQDHKDLFLPLYLVTSFDALVAAWEKLDRKLERKGARWRLINELRRPWVPRWGKWSEGEIRGGVGGIGDRVIVSWETNQTTARLLLVDPRSVEPSVGTIRR